MVPNEPLTNSNRAGVEALAGSPTGTELREAIAPELSSRIVDGPG
jgi:hypothetical protein